jgi:acetyl esterase/lipase
MTTNGSGNVEHDVVFGRGGDTDLKLNVYKPAAGTGNGAAVIHLHGGGFRGGAKENVERTLDHLTERGYVGIASQYRLGTQAKWPAQIHDVKAAIRWTRANAARLGIDPNKICIAGYSAGGHLALMAASTQNDASLEGEGGNAGAGTQLAACLAYYPGVDTARGPDGSEHILMNAGASDDDYRAASPIRHVGAGNPPTVLLHATGDTTIPFGQSLRVFNKLREANVPVEIHLYDGLSHVFDRHPEFAAPTAEVCALFLDRHVVNPRTYPPFEGPARPAAEPAITR